jgi:hypothetical protein
VSEVGLSVSSPGRGHRPASCGESPFHGNFRIALTAGLGTRSAFVKTEFTNVQFARAIYGDTITIHLYLLRPRAIGLLAAICMLSPD